MEECCYCQHEAIKLKCGDCMCEYCLSRLKILSCPECGQELKEIPDIILQKIIQNIKRVKELDYKYKSTPKDYLKSFLKSLSYEELHDLHLEIFGFRISGHIGPVVLIDKLMVS